MAKKMCKKTKKQKPTYVVIDGLRIVTNFPWKGIDGDYAAFLEANADTRFVSNIHVWSDGDRKLKSKHWAGTAMQLYKCALARGMALRTDSGASRKAKRAKKQDAST